jgi:quercetin dioxygenase-like cupin family protein
MSRRLRAVALAAGLTVTGLGALAAAGYGDPSGLAITPLALATLAGPVHAQSGGVQIDARAPRDAFTARLRFTPGGTSGWHTHPGPVIVQVASGTLTLRQPTLTGCTSRTVDAGQGFVEDGGRVHEVTAGSDGAVVYATFLARPHTADWLVPQPEPPGC